MGNCCCPLGRSCDHTVDEARGLLNSDSKALGSVGGAEVVNSVPKVNADDSEHEGENGEEQVVPAQPDAVPQARTESSYSSVIQSLHTDVSHAEQDRQSASPEGADATEDAGVTGETGQALAEVPDACLDSAEGPVEVAPPEAAEEREAEMNDSCLKMDEETLAGAAVRVAPADDVVSQEPLSDKGSDAQGEEEQETCEDDADKEQSKAPAEVLVLEDAARSKEPTTKIPAADGHDAEDLTTPSVMAQDADGTEMQETEVGSATPQVSPVEPTGGPDVAEEAVSAQAISEEPGTQSEDNADDACKEDAATTTVGVKEHSLTSPAEEHLKRVCSPDMETNNEPTPHTMEISPTDDLADLSDDHTCKVEAGCVRTALQETEKSLKTCKEPLQTGNQAEAIPEPSSNISSTAEEVDKHQSGDTTTDQEEIPLSISKGQEVAECLLNGLDSFAPVQKPDFTETQSDTAQEDDTKLKSEVTEPIQALSLDEHTQEEEEPEAQPTEKETEETVSVFQETAHKEDTASLKGQKGEIILTSSHAIEVAVIPVVESESFADQKEQKDEDLYRAAEETQREPAQEKQLKTLLEFTIPGVDESCSLAATVDILAYSEREWKGNTAKSALIRKGYSEMSCSFSGLRRVRGDNYCALRATLYQVLTTTTQTPAWLLEDSFTALPEKLEAQEHLIGEWVFPSECRKEGEVEDAVDKLKRYLELLQKKWQTMAGLEDPEEKRHACERAFQGGEEEYGLLEALKLLMLARAVELHAQMQTGQDVPLFCWLLFARDTSETPRTFLTNHLSQVGIGGGVEQVEMFLLGYALQHTIQAFRLYKMDTEEFVTHYPDDHKQDWPCVSIVTEDDRHYNVPVRKQAQHLRHNDISLLLPLMS